MSGGRWSLGSVKPMADVELNFVVMDTRLGQWCDACALPSVVTVTLAAGLKLMDITRCTECLDWGAP